MKKFRQLILIITAAVACVCMCFAFAACTEEDTKYDVAIRVECSDGRIYEFPVGTDELHIEIPYTGRERTYKVSKYFLEGHSDLWIDQIDSPFATRYFTLDISKVSEDNGYEDVESITDHGDYCVQIRTDTPILSLTNYKQWSLFIKIK